MLEVAGCARPSTDFVAIDRCRAFPSSAAIAAVIGPNGAGKSTLFNLITGTCGPTAAQVLLEDRDITGAPPHKICRMGMGRSFQRTNIFPKLTVFENVQAAFIAHRRRGTNFWRLSERLYRDETEALIALARRSPTRPIRSAGALSHGNQKQVELGIALAGDPRCCCSTSRPPACRRAETHETHRAARADRARSAS